MYNRYFKRVLDIFAAGALLIGFSPVILVICILYWVFSLSGPVFRQSRPGKDEVLFNILKFQTMTSDTNEQGILLPDEDRITWLGSFLRKSSLDELPQLWNVLRGDMSLVGPRPLRIRYLPYYYSEERTRHLLRPGITGLAQVSGRNALGWDEKLQLDVYYVKNVSFALDLQVLFKTAYKVFRSDEVNFESKSDSLDAYRNFARQD